MRNNPLKLAWVGVFLLMTLQQAKADFIGKIALDSTWQKVAYLSLLPSFEDMHTLNKDFVIGEAAVDENGTFSFDTEFLSKHEALYRVHFIKRGDPIATLIMGGKHENHFFFVASRSDSIQMLLKSADEPISETHILGLDVNRVIAQVNEYKKAYYQMSGENAALKAQLLDLAFKEQLLQLADSTQYIMAGLYALYQGNYNNGQNSNAYQAFIEKWENDKSLYFREFAQKMAVPETDRQGPLWIIIALALGILLGSGISAAWFKKQQKLELVDEKEELVNELSVQEKKVYRLLENGMSNKEISNELNIGVNTVKSHVSSVLGKLKVKSRKELMV